MLAFVFLAWTSGGGVPHLASASSRAQSPALGVVIGVFVTGAVIAAIVGWRRHAGRPAGWTAAVGALIAGQALLAAMPAMATAQPTRSVAWGSLPLFMATIGMICTLTALGGLARARHVADDTFGAGLGLGLVASGHLVLLIPHGLPLPLPMEVLIGLLVGTQLVAGGVVLGLRLLPGPVARLLVATALVVGAGLGVDMGDVHGSAWDALASLAMAAVGAAWLANAWACVHRSAERAAARRLEDLDFAMLAMRDQREQMHELRSTIAGLVNGTAMLDNAALPDHARVRLQESVRRELNRMQRLLSDSDESVSDIDLDEALGLILELQRLKGRQVELHTSGDLVRARYDSLAEVVNILIDNAVTHGGSEHSVVDVHRRDDETVDITVTDAGRGIPAEQRDRIFEWGQRSEESPGEGIGLHVARRLVARDGGSLRLGEAQGPGSSFVISLPAPRRSSENDLFEEEHHVARRISS